MNPDPALGTLLPAWLAYVRLVVAPLVAFAATYCGLALTSRLLTPRLQQLKSLHWSELARRIAPVRFVLSTFLYTGAFLFGSLYATERGSMTGFSPIWSGLFAACAAFAGASLASQRFAKRATGDSISWFRHARSLLIVTFFVAPQLLILFFLLVTVGPELRGSSAIAAVGGSVALVLCARYSGLPVARLLGAVRAPSSQVLESVRAVADEMGVTVKSVELIDLELVNAFALPVAGRIVLTTGLVETLSDEELRAVVSHEVGHLMEPRRSVLMRSLGIMAFLPLGLLVPIGHAFGKVGPLACFGVFFLVSVGTNALTRRAERSADAAARSSSVSPESYARALERLHEANLSPVVTSGLSTHPDLYDRMRAAGVEPTFPRPAPPSRLRSALGLVLCLGLVFAFGALIYGAALIAIAVDPDEERAAVAGIALHGARAPGLFRLARVRMGEGRDENALGLVDAALRLDPGRHTYLAARSKLLAASGRCQLAEEALISAWTHASSEHAPECKWISRAEDALAKCETAHLEPVEAL